MSKSKRDDMLCCAAQGLLSVPGQKWRSKLHVPFFILFSQGITCRRPTHRHTGLSPQVYRSSTCERRDQPQLRLTRKNVITYKYNFLLKLADEIETISKNRPDGLTDDSNVNAPP